MTIHWQSATKHSLARFKGTSIYVDLSFGKTSKGGLHVFNGSANPAVDPQSSINRKPTFGKLAKAIKRAIDSTSDRRVLLVLEAPLHQLYDKNNGCPIPRKVDDMTLPDPFGRRESPWYMQAGANVHLGAVRLVQRLEELLGEGDESTDIVLAEGFVSFKGSGRPDAKAPAKELNRIYTNICEWVTRKYDPKSVSDGKSPKYLKDYADALILRAIHEQAKFTDSGIRSTLGEIHDPECKSTEDWHPIAPGLETPPAVLRYEPSRWLPKAA